MLNTTITQAVIRKAVPNFMKQYIKTAKIPASIAKKTEIKIIAVINEQPPSPPPAHYLYSGSLYSPIDLANCL